MWGAPLPSIDDQTPRGNRTRKLPAASPTPLGRFDSDFQAFRIAAAVSGLRYRKKPVPIVNPGPSRFARSSSAAWGFLQGLPPFLSVLPALFTRFPCLYRPRLWSSPTACVIVAEDA